MSDVFGVVRRIVSKPRGRGTAYNVQMDDGSWYGHGFQQPQFGEGAEIAFDVSWNGQYGNINLDTLEIVSPGHTSGQRQPQQQRGGSQENRGGQHGGHQAQQRQQAAQGARGMSKDDYWERKEKRDLLVQKQIQYQAARNAAIEVVKAGLESGAVKLPAAKDKSFDALLGLVDEVTLQYDGAVSSLASPNKPQRQVPQQSPTVDDVEDDSSFDDTDIPF